MNIGSDGRGAFGFNGLIDEVRIYARARSPEDVSSDMNRAVDRDSPGSDLVAAYGFNSGPDSIAVDASGAVRLVLSREATWVPDGRFGGAMSFDGRGSRVIVADAAFDFTRGFTVEAWVFPAQSLGEDALVVADGGEGFFLRATSFESSLPLSGLRFGGAPRMVGPRRSIPLRRWTHLATTFDGRFLRMYIDGQLAGVTAHWSTHQPSHVTLNSADLPFGIMRNPQRLPEILLSDFSLDVAVTCGALLKQPAPFFVIAGIQSIDALELIATGSEVRVRYPRKAQRLGLAAVDQRIGGALDGCAEGQSRRFVVQGPLQRSTLRDVAGRELKGVRPGVGSAWSFLLDSQLLPLWLVALVSGCCLAAAAFPFGLWSRGLASSTVAVVALLANVFLVPRFWGLQAPGGFELLAIAAGASLGVVMSRKLPQGAVSGP